MQLTQQFQNDFSTKDITLDFEFLLRLVNAFTVGTEEYPLLKVHDFTLCAHKSYVYILQIGSLEKKILLQCCILSDLIRRISIIFVRLSSLTKGQQTSKIKPVNIQSRSFRVLIKGKPTDMELSIYLKSYIYRYSYKIETAIYIATKHEKTIMAVI